MLRSNTILACHFSILKGIWLEVITTNIWLVVFGASFEFRDIKQSYLKTVICPHSQECFAEHLLHIIQV
jgi:hypothetical protein